MCLQLKKALHSDVCSFRKKSCTVTKYASFFHFFWLSAEIYDNIYLVDCSSRQDYTVIALPKCIPIFLSFQAQIRRHFQYFLHTYLTTRLFSTNTRKLMSENEPCITQNIAKRCRGKLGKLMKTILWCRLIKYVICVIWKIQYLEQGRFSYVIIIR